MQPLANTVWAYATLGFGNGPLLQAIAAQSMKRMPQWHVQELVNTAWSVAKLSFDDAPLRASISAAAMPRLPEYEARDLSITAWSCAVLGCKDGPLLEAIALASRGRLAAFSRATATRRTFPTLLGRLPLSTCPTTPCSMPSRALRSRA